MMNRRWTFTAVSGVSALAACLTYCYLASLVCAASRIIWKFDWAATPYVYVLTDSAVTFVIWAAVWGGTGLVFARLYKSRFVRALGIAQLSAASMYCACIALSLIGTSEMVTD